MQTSFEHNGFTVIRELFAPGEIDQIRRAVDRLFDDYARLPAGHAYDLDRLPTDGSPGKIPAIRDVLKLLPELRDSPGLARAVELAERVIGPGAEILWDSAIYKPAGSSSETPLHQDDAVYGLAGIRKPRSIVYYWVALDTVGESSGCMRFLPGSHRGALLQHAWRNGDPTTSLMLSEPIDESALVAVPMRPGDASLHHVRILHGSGPNNSDSCRKGWILGVGLPSTPRWLRRMKRAVVRIVGRSGGK